MYRKTLLASALAVLMAASASLVLAQNPPPPPSAPHAMDGRDMHAAHGDLGMRLHRFDRGHDGLIGDLHGLERLYLQAGRGKELASVYNDVLAKSQDPRVRDYVYKRLARLQAQPANVDQAIATMRKALDESLANEAKRRAEREQIRARWQQRANQPTGPAAK